jgi:glutamine amidotransferase
MSKLTVGIVDYGIGNHASVRHCLHQLDLRCRVSDDPAVLGQSDLLLLPGVGAFRPSMQALQAAQLDQFLIMQAAARKPLLGICLGMQLLTDGSHEDGRTAGLGLIPGEAVPFGALKWHIGWNTIEAASDDPLFEQSIGQAFYFNHSFAYAGPREYHACVTKLDDSFASVIRRDNIVGLQFHPEKSQAAGHALLKQLIEGMCDA